MPKGYSASRAAGNRTMGGPTSKIKHGVTGRGGKGIKGYNGGRGANQSINPTIK